MDLGVYLHVPFCKHECPYCDFYKMELRDRPARTRLDFPLQLGMELNRFLEDRPELRERTLATIYFGGGTPSTLVPGAVGELIMSIQGGFRHAVESPEVTLEANPENLTPARCAKWREAGVNRLSIGAQSFDERELRLLERLHDARVIRSAVGNARRAGFANISLDLMFALPGQTMETWESNLREAVALGPQHVSFYGLTYHENTPFEAWRRAGRIASIDEEAQAAMYIRGAEFLEAQGFEHYEVSNFARAGFRSRHNQRYWSRADVLGLGPGAHSNVGSERWSNAENLDEWVAALRAGDEPPRERSTLDAGQSMHERLFTALRRAEGVRRGEGADLYTRCMKWYADAAPEADSWIIADGESFRLTRAGWLVSDAIIDRIQSC